MNYKFFPKSKDELQDIIKIQIFNFGNIVDLNNINTTQITDMRYLFYNSKFNGNISKWDISNVTNMSYMFSKSNFNNSIFNWNVSNVTDMYSMFENSKFNKDISNWDVNNVIDMAYMFKNSLFNNDISQWFLKIKKICDLSYFIKNKNIEINSYNDFKNYHRKMILTKL